MSTHDIELFRSLYCRVDDAYGVMDECGTRTIRDLLTEDVLRHHLEGKKRIGAFFLDKEGMTDQLTIDIDEPKLDQAIGVWKAFRDLRIYAYIESSKSKGFHVRSHWSPPLPAADLRNVGKYVATQAGISNTEVFPKQDSRGEGGLGNFMFLPLHGGSLQKGKTSLLDPENGFHPVADPWEVLPTIQLNPPETLAAALSKVERTSAHDFTPQPFSLKDDRIPDGSRNTTLTSHAGKLRRKGATEEEIFSAIQAENQDRCDPPLPEEEVRKIAKSVSKYPAKQPPHSKTQPVIDAGFQNLPYNTAEAWAAITEKNNPPKLFLYGGEPVRLGTDEHRELALQRLTIDRMRYEVARSAHWIRYKKRKGSTEEKSVYPPKEIIQDMLADPKIPLPHLTGIVNAPIFSSSGNLIVTPGFDQEAGIYYAPGDNLHIPKVANRPSLDDLEYGRNILLTELLGDFPFVSDAEKSHAISLLLLPFVRLLIVGPTPLHLIEKPTPGTGASLLAQVLLYPATGKWTPAMTEGGDENEWRKRITAKLREGASPILIDNLRKRLDSAAIAAALTATEWMDRKLGSSDNLQIPNRSLWVATGNNPTVSSEISRRTIRIRLDAKQDQPWLRKGFRHPDLKAWVERNRSIIVWSALVLVQHWIAGGRPVSPSLPVLGMYERYSTVMGGILHHCNTPGFLSNLNSFYEESDDEGASIRPFVAAWWEIYKSSSVGVAQLFDIASSNDSTIELGNGQERSQKTRLGKLLGKLRDCRYQLSANHTVRIDRVQAPTRAAQWRLQRDEG